MKKLEICRRTFGDERPNEVTIYDEYMISKQGVEMIISLT